MHINVHIVPMTSCTSSTATSPLYSWFADKENQVLKHYSYSGVTDPWQKLLKETSSVLLECCVVKLGGVVSLASLS